MLQYVYVAILSQTQGAHTQGSALCCVLCWTWPRLLYCISVLHQLFIQLSNFIIEPAGAPQFYLSEEIPLQWVPRPQILSKASSEKFAARSMLVR
jgi:hypothetical protein